MTTDSSGTSPITADSVQAWMSRGLSIVGWLALLILVIWAGWVRFHIPPVALSEYDSWGWLSPALDWLGGQGFREEYEREWLYGAFMAFCLKVTGSFAGYVIIQQILGLGAAVVMWLTWKTWLSLLPRNLVAEALASVMGLFVIALYLFNPVILVMELSIRPEAILAFFGFLQLLCITCYCKFRWLHPRPVLSLVFGALAMLFAYALFILKPNWLLAVPMTTVPIFFGLFGRNFPVPTRWATPAAGFLLIVVLLWIPDKALFIRKSQTRLVLPMTLFTIHADIIRQSMASELEDTSTPPERKAFLAAFLPELDRELTNARTEKNATYRRLGFDPDYLMYRSSLFHILKEQHQMTQPDIAAFCRKSFLDAILREPSAYARKIGIQMGYFVFPDDDTFFRKEIKLPKLYEHSLVTLPKSPNESHNTFTQALLQSYLDSHGPRLGSDEKITAIRPFREFLKSAKRYAPAIVSAGLLAFVASWIWPSLAAYRLPGFAALILLAAPAGNALTVACVHALDNDRYRGSYGSLLMLALSALFVFALYTLACGLTKAYRKFRRGEVTH